MTPQARNSSATVLQKMQKSLFVLLVCWTVITWSHVWTENLLNDSSRDETTWQYHCAKSYEIGLQRLIPPLEGSLKAAKPKLKQLMVMTRHGSRTPTHPHPDCWSSFPRLKWECKAAEGFSTDSYVTSDNTTRREFTFHKTYADISKEGRNSFNGNCREGQLLEEGAKQLSRVGSVISAAYFEGAHDPLLNAKQLPVYENTFVSLEDMKLNDTYHFGKIMHARTTDMERTRMSAANFLSSLYLGMYDGFFGSRTDFEIPAIHVLDVTTDYLRHPKISQSALDVEQSKEFKDLMISHEPLAHRIMPYLPGSKPSDWPWADKLFDCTKSVMCTEWLYPNGKERVPTVFQKHPELIQEFFLAYIDKVNLSMRWKQSVIPKFSAYTFTRLLRTIVIRAVCASCFEGEDSVNTAVTSVKAVPELRAIGDSEIQHAAQLGAYLPLHYWSIHDSTLNALLNSNGFHLPIFPALASLLVFEVYEVPSADFHGVRVLFNSKDITFHLPGCTGDSLCNVKSFFDATKWATTYSEAEAGGSVDINQPVSTAGMFGWWPVLLLLTSAASVIVALLCQNLIAQRRMKKDKQLKEDAAPVMPINLSGHDGATAVATGSSRSANGENQKLLDEATAV